MHPTLIVILLSIYSTQSCSVDPQSTDNPSPTILNLQLLSNDFNSVLLNIRKDKYSYCKQMDSTNGNVSDVQCSNYTNKWSSGDIDPTHTSVHTHFDNTNNILNIYIERNGERTLIQDELLFRNTNDIIYTIKKHKSFTLNSLFTTFILLSFSDEWTDDYQRYNPYDHAIAIKFNGLYDNKYKILSGYFHMDKPYLAVSGGAIDVYESVQSIKLPLVPQECSSDSHYLASYNVSINESTNEFIFTLKAIANQINVDSESGLAYSWGAGFDGVYVYDLNNGLEQRYVFDLMQRYESDVKERYHKNSKWYFLYFLFALPCALMVGIVWFQIYQIQKLGKEGVELNNFEGSDCNEGTVIIEGEP